MFLVFHNWNNIIAIFSIYKDPNLDVSSLPLLECISLLLKFEFLNLSIIMLLEYMCAHEWQHIQIWMFLVFHYSI